jgi:hypothetical protein
MGDSDWKNRDIAIMVITRRKDPQRRELLRIAQVNDGELTQIEMSVVGECLRASAYGPFFDDDEFHTLFGLERPGIAALAERWPNVDEMQERSICGINNSMGQMIGYPHNREDAWPDYISVSEEEVLRIFNKWRRLKRDRFEGEGYFDKAL